MNEPVSGLTPAGAIADADLLYVVQAGTSKQATALQIKTYANVDVGNLKMMGGWDASTNTPALASGIGTAWEGYVVTTAGVQTLDGVKSWFLGDILWFDGATNKWERIGNTTYKFPLTIAGFFDATNGDAFDNNAQPVGTLVSGVGIPWNGYGASNVGNYNLDGETDWEPGDLALFNGITNLWQKGIVTYLNGRSGNIAFPAVQNLIMFGSSDDWIEQDADFSYDPVAKTLIARGDTTATTNLFTSIVMPGSFNTYEDLTNCTVGGGFSNTLKRATESLDLSGAGGVSDLSGGRWHIRLGGTDALNTAGKFTSINSDTINNTGDYCSFWGTQFITNTTAKTNAAAFGYGNAGVPFDFPYDNQGHMFFDSLIIGPSARHEGNTGLVFTGMAGSVTTTNFPLSTYVTLITDFYIRFANTNAGASLTYSLPPETDLSEGQMFCCNDVTGNMGAAAVAQSASGKLINGALTYNINFANGYWVFIWCKSLNIWDAKRLA